MSARAYPPRTSRMLLVVENVAMAAFYYGLGRLALLLAIPPRYASTIWPSAGLALAGMLAFRYRVWPGIFVGHFLVNLFPSFGVFQADGIRRQLLHERFGDRVGGFRPFCGSPSCSPSGCSDARMVSTRR